MNNDDLLAKQRLSRQLTLHENKVKKEQLNQVSVWKEKLVHPENEYLDLGKKKK